MSIHLPDLIAAHGDPLEAVDRVPRTTTELYYRWTSAPRNSLSRREKRERRVLGRYLRHLSRHERVRMAQVTCDDRRVMYFWRDSSGYGEVNDAT